MPLYPFERALAAARSIIPPFSRAAAAPSPHRAARLLPILDVCTPPRHFRVADPPDTPKASGREIRSSSVLHEYRCPANEKAASIWLHFERFSYILPIASAHPFHAPGSRPVCTAKKPDNVLKIRHKAKSLFLGQPSARLLPFAEPLTRAGTVLKTWKIHLKLSHTSK